MTREAGLTPSLNLARLDLISIRLVVLCAESGNLSSAARQANMSISGASHRLSCMEQSLGKRLFTRHHRGMTLTPAGQVTVEHGYRLLMTIEQLSGQLLKAID